MKKMTRKAQVLTFGILIILFLTAGFLILRPHMKEEVKEEPKYSVQLVAENQQLVSTYIDAISKDKSSNEYKEYKITLEKGRKIGEHELSSKQFFSKLLKLEGPNEKDVLSKKSKQVITHNAYSMLLVGDVQEKTNLNTKEKTYEIVNARITYDRIPFVLMSNENSVCLSNLRKTKEKIVNLQEFINALKNVEKRNDMIDW